LIHTAKVPDFLKKKWVKMSMHKLTSVYTFADSIYRKKKFLLTKFVSKNIGVYIYTSFYLIIYPLSASFFDYQNVFRSQILYENSDDDDNYHELQENIISF